MQLFTKYLTSRIHMQFYLNGVFCIEKKKFKQLQLPIENILGWKTHDFIYIFYLPRHERL